MPTRRVPSFSSAQSDAPVAAVGIAARMPTPTSASAAGATRRPPNASRIHALDLEAAGLVTGPLFAGGRTAWERTVERVVAAVDAGAEPRRPLAEVTLELPFAVADFVDFYSSLEHAAAIGRLFRPGTEPLFPN